jgi:hypothetical protein
MQRTRQADDGLEEKDRRDRSALGCVDRACKGKSVQLGAVTRGRCRRQRLQCLTCHTIWTRVWVD